MTKTLDNALRTVAAAIVIGVLVGLLAWSGSAGTETGSAAPASVQSSHVVDFNNPTTLAWAVGLETATASGSLHDVACEHTGDRTFTCVGFSSRGRQRKESIRVSRDGSSWTAT